MSRRRTGSAGAGRNTRDLGLVGGGSGKGDADRTTNRTAFQSNYDLINWSKKKVKKP